MKIFWFFILLVSHLFLNAQNEYEVMIQRLRSDALDKAGFIATTEVDLSLSQYWLKTMAKDGSWADVNYKDTKNTWSPLKHLDRMLIMSYAYCKDSCKLYESNALFDGIQRSLIFWYKEQPRCVNWYKNDIAKQYRFNVIALLLKDKLDSTLLTKLVNDLTPEVRMSGTNKLNLAFSVLYRGVIEEDPIRIQKAVDGIKSTLASNGGEGIQSDYTFHQHGAMLYNGDYGLRYIAEVCRFAAIVQNSQFALSKADIQLLGDYYLKGLRWNLRSQLLDYNVRGRGVGSYRGNSMLAEVCVPVAECLAMLDVDRKELYLASKSAILNRHPQNINGVKHFWRSDYTVSHQPAFFMSLKMCSKRTIGIERGINGENQMGYFLPYGLTYIWCRGDEYKSIFPVWDWACLPGVTCPHQEISLHENNERKTSQNTDLVGGVHGEHGGVSVMNFDYEKTQGLKTWFWYKDMVLAIGKNIQSDHDNNIITGVNQCLLNGEVWVDKILTKDSLIHDFTSCWHDGIAYYFVDKQNNTLSKGQQYGSWHKIFSLASKDTISKPVFKLWVNHGKHPAIASYAYIIEPGISLIDYKKRDYPKPVIVQNKSEIIEVFNPHDKSLGLVINQKGSYNISLGYELTISEPCLVWIEKTGEKESALFLSDPTAELNEIEIKLRRKDGEYMEVKRKLPTNGHAGKTIKINL